MSFGPRGKRQVSLTTRLVAWVLALLAVVLLSFAAATLALTARDLGARLDDQVHQAAQRSQAFARHGRDGTSPRDPMQAPGQGAGVLTVVLSAGQVTTARWQDNDGDITDLEAHDVDALRSAGAFDAAPRTPGGGPDQWGALRTVDLSIGEYRVETRAAGGPNSDGQTVIVTGLPTSAATGPVTTLAIVEGLGILVSLAVAAVVGLAVIRRELRPLQDVSSVASRVGSLPLHSPSATLPSDRVPAELAVPGTEVGNVGAALNHLLDNVSTALVARQRSEQSLREFVADASHELRTPLASVRGYADMIRLTEELTPDGALALSRVDSQARRMNALVDDLLLLARLDAGRPMEATPVDLSELVLDAVMDAQVAGKEHHWEVRLPDEDSPAAVVMGEGRQLTQVISNLLSNARKHTAPGTTVTTSLSVVGDAVVLRVHDDGPGIPAAFLPRLFDRFARSDAQRSTKGKEGSTGLGLAIVAAVVERHGGTIACESEPGDTTFTVTLPLADRLPS